MYVYTGLPEEFLFHFDVTERLSILNYITIKQMKRSLHQYTKLRLPCRPNGKNSIKCAPRERVKPVTSEKQLPA